MGAKRRKPTPGSEPPKQRAKVVRNWAKRNAPTPFVAVQQAAWAGAEREAGADRRRRGDGRGVL
jgi:hypothetical protein